MSMFTEYGITKEEMQTMKTQSDEFNYQTFGFTFTDLIEVMQNNGHNEEDFIK